MLKILDAPEVVKDALLRLFAHGTGVEQDDIGVFRRIGLDDIVASGQHVGHLVRVVLVHLAAEGADVQLFRGHSGKSGSCESGL